MCNPNPDLDVFNAGFDTAKVNVIYLLDTSYSMEKNGRIGQLNAAMLTAFETADDVCNDLDVELSIRVIQFNSNAKYVIGTPETGASYEEAVHNWKDLGVSGSTRTDLAVEEALKCMHTKYLGSNNYQPIVFLITDGYSDDYDTSTHDTPVTNKAFDKLAHCLKNSKGESRVMRVGLGVQDADRAQLERFASTAIFTDEDGREVEAPIVAEVQDVATLKGVLSQITKSSIISSTGYEDEGQKVVIQADPDDEGDNWVNDIIAQNQSMQPDDV